MRILPDTNYKEVKDLDLYVVHNNEEAARFHFASLFIFWYSLFCYGIFNFIGERGRFFHILEKFVKLFRSVLAGLFIAIFFMNDRVKMFVQNPFFIYDIFEPSNFPVLTISIVYLLVFLSVFFRKRIKIKTDQLFDFKRDVDMFSLNKRSDDKKKSLIRFVLTKVKNNVLLCIKDFNRNDAPLIYLLYVFFHAFFVGLGFSGIRYIGWTELQILLHKIFEILSLTQSLKTLRFRKNKFIAVFLLFSLITSFGILCRGYLALHNVRYDNMLATKICDSIFAQSVHIIICVELIIPVPISKLDLVINWLITFLSYMSFKSYLS